MISRDLTEHMRAAKALLNAQIALAHANRVTTMGQLTASIAHEVNQPLAAVVANAEACLRWLDRGTPDLERGSPLGGMDYRRQQSGEWGDPARSGAREQDQH